MLQCRAEQTKGEERPGGQVAEDLEKKTGFCGGIAASGSSAGGPGTSAGWKLFCVTHSVLGNLSHPYF